MANDEEELLLEAWGNVGKMPETMVSRPMGQLVNKPYIPRVLKQDGSWELVEEFM